MESTELMHYGVKGMKWGVRKKRDTEVTRTKAAYKTAKKEYNKAYNRTFNSLSVYGSMSPSKKHRDAYDKRVEDVVDKAYRMDDAKKAYKAAKKQAKAAAKESRQKTPSKSAENLKKAAAKGAKATAGCLAKVGQAYVTDQLFFGGYGTAAAKEAIRGVGMAVITAYTMARGGYDIKWYDKQGRRVG